MQTRHSTGINIQRLSLGGRIADEGMPGLGSATVLMWDYGWSNVVLYVCLVLAQVGSQVRVERRLYFIRVLRHSRNKRIAPGVWVALAHVSGKASFKSFRCNVQAMACQLDNL